MRVVVCNWMPDIESGKHPWWKPSFLRKNKWVIKPIRERNGDYTLYVSKHTHDAILKELLNYGS